VTICGVVLAGGEGRRFGTPKQLAPLDGRPLLQHALDTAVGSPALDRVVLVLGSEADRVETAIEPGRADVVVCPDWDEGVAASLRAGVVAAADAKWVVVLLGDEPDVPGEAVARVVAATGEAPDAVRAVCATWAGRPGHPVALHADLLGRVLKLRGDTGARALLGDVPVLDVECGDLGTSRDVDTPADLAKRPSSAG
jgi:CTP:molybdopterin cytidylyltransferase MocA